MVKFTVNKGGPGSGHFGHAGRPGKVGGSVPSSVAMSIRTGRTAKKRQEEAAKKAAERSQRAAKKAEPQAETLSVAGYTWEVEPPKFVDNYEDVQVREKYGLKSLGYMILGDNRMVDITGEFGGGTNDHVGFAVAGDNPKLFGMSREQADRFLESYVTGNDVEHIVEGWDTIFNSGAIRVRQFGDEVDIETATIDRRTLRRLQRLYDEGKLHIPFGTTHYWEAGIGRGSVRFTFRDFLDADFVDVEGQRLKEVSQTEEGPTMKVVLKGRGNIKGLAKHLKKMHPDTDGFFTFCMSEMADGYPDKETRASVCARAHFEAFGKWPAEDPSATEKETVLSFIVRSRIGSG